MILEAPPNAGKVAAIAYDTLAKKDGSWVQVNLKTDTELDSMLKMPEVSKRILDELRHK